MLPTYWTLVQNKKIELDLCVLIKRGKNGWKLESVQITYFWGPVGIFYNTYHLFLKQLMHFTQFLKKSQLITEILFWAYEIFYVINFCQRNTQHSLETIIIMMMIAVHFFILEDASEEDECFTQAVHIKKVICLCCNNPSFSSADHLTQEEWDQHMQRLYYCKYNRCFFLLTSLALSP